MEKERYHLGLVPRIIIAIILGILIGSYAPEMFSRLVITASSIFSSFLRFVIPIMILAFVTMGIADLTHGAGKLLALTAALAYGSTLLAGSIAYIVAINLFPGFIAGSSVAQIDASDKGGLAPFFPYR